MSFLFGSNNQTVTNQTTLPPYVENQVTSNLDIANKIASGQWPAEIGQYPKYTGQRFAPLSRQEQVAGGMLDSGAMSNPNIDMATAATQRGMTSYGGTFGPSQSILQGIMSGADRTPVEFQQMIGASAQPYGGNFDTQGYDAVSSYMNPYQQNVISEVQRQGDVNRNNIRAQAAKAGAFGGSRAALLEAQNNEATQRQVGLQQQQAYQNAQQALQGQQGLQLQQQVARAGQYNTDQNRALQSGTTLASLFANDANRSTQVGDLLSRLQLSTQGMQADQFNKDRQAVTSGGSQLANIGEMQRTGQYDLLRSLMGYGGMTRGVDQQQKDFDYGQFTEARDWPTKMLQIRQSAVSGQPYPTSSTTNQPGASTASQGIGMLAALAGLGGKNGFGWWG